VATHLGFRTAVVTGAVALGIVSLFVAAVFAYGYWHTVTHGVFRVDVRDSFGRQVRNSDAELTFLDDSGRVLGQSATEDAGGLFYVSGEFSCREIEKRAAFEVGGYEAYSQCFERQTRWVVKWVYDLRYVDVRIGGCRWNKVPAIVSRQSTGPSDWWLLWPTRHIGGSPFT
jgi:hypothetical protein